MACAALTTSLTAGCVDSGATTSTGLTSETASAVGYGGVPTLPDRFPIPKALTSAEQRRNAPSSVTASIGTDGAVESLEIPEEYDLIAFDAAAGTDIVVSFDVTDAVGKTALAVLEPDGSVLEQVHADGDGAVYVPKTVRTGGTHFVQVAGLENSSGKYSLSVSTNETTAEQSPYQGTVSSLPGRIQAEDFDIGGEGVSYHDTSEGNEYDTSYRDTSVDIRRTQDSSGQYNIGYFQDGEWLEYTVDPTSGTYDLHLRVATPRTGRELELTLGGEPLTTVDVPNTGGWRAWETVTVEDVEIDTDGESVLRVEANNSGIDLNWFEFERVNTQQPYQGTVAPIPGRIQAEDFDTGGEGMSYHDTSEGNEYDTSYRDTSVDIRRTQDSSGQYNIGYFQDGEWLEYTVDPTSGTYDLRVRVASANSGRQLKLTLDGEPLATVDVPNTGGWRNWETVTLENLDINTDAQSVLRLEAVKSGIDLNWFEFEPKSSQRPYEESAVKLPDRVQAEDFDVGGEGVSYHDTSEGNEYDTSYRDTSVDIRRTQDSSGQYNIGYFQDGEWLEYTVDPTSGTYDLRVRVASANSGRQLKLTLDGEPLVTIDVPNTGGWRNWETVRVRGVGFDSDGEQVLRFEAVGSGIDLNWFEVVGSSDSDSDYGELSYGEQQYGGSSS